MSEQTPVAESGTDEREQAAPDAEPQAEDLLIEEISIDGMCGVY